MTRPSTLLHDILQIVIEINRSGAYFAWYEISAHVGWIRVHIAPEDNFSNTVYDSADSVGNVYSTPSIDRPVELLSLRDDLRQFRQEHNV